MPRPVSSAAGHLTGVLRVTLPQHARAGDPSGPALRTGEENHPAQYFASNIGVEFRTSATAPAVVG